MSRESLEPPRAPHFAPINCVCQTVKVQGPVSGNKKRGQKGLLRLSSEITSNTPSPLLEGVSAAGQWLQMHTALGLVNLSRFKNWTTD